MTKQEYDLKLWDLLGAGKHEEMKVVYKNLMVSVVLDRTRGIPKRLLKSSTHEVDYSKR